MTLKPYPEYKESGVAWLGNVPKSWAMMKFRAMLSPVSERNRTDLPLLSVVREKGVIKRNITDTDENHNYIPDDLSNYKVVKCGQFAMNKMKAWQGSYGISKHDGIVSPAYYVFKLKSAIPEFFHLAVRSKAYVPFFTQASDGIRVGQWDLSQTRLKEIPFWIPSEDEQNQIVRYIDYKSSQINRFIRNKKRMIELLKEQKQVIINDAVTGKNDVTTGKPYPKYKDSGVEWLGQVPEGWEVRYFFQSFREKCIKNIGGKEQNRLSLSYGQIIRKNIDATEGLLPASFDTYQIVNCGDIILRLTDLQNDHKSLRVGFVRETGIITSAYLCLVVYKGIMPEYAALLLHVYDLRKVFYGMGGGVRQSIGFNELKRLPFIIPNLNEQEQILNFITSETNGLNLAIDKFEREISLIQEYRTRLISDVVTGIVDVRGIDVPDVVEDELVEVVDETEDITDEMEVADVVD